MRKIFKVTLIGKSPTYPVIGDEHTTLEAVWDSQKSLFAPGTKVLIQNAENHIQIFEKERKHHG